VNKLARILVFSGISGAAFFIALISLTIGWRPFVGPKARPLTSRKFESTPQRLERGRYLFTAVAGCSGCHSQHDPSQHGAPIIAGTEGGGEVMPVAELPGRVVASNITPDPQTGSGNWSDDQLARAIREGIGHDGRTLFPMMPYEHFRKMSDEDLASLVVYIRSMPPLRHDLPKTEIIFPVKYLMRSAPEPVTAPVSAPDPADRVRWGGYLVHLANCDFCHTPRERGQPTVDGLELAGGWPMTVWGISAATANITPDASGIGYYDEALFIQALRTGYVRARKLSSIMPFSHFKNLTDDDLKAMFAYLRTLKPVKHRVDNTEPPTYCKLCRLKHGGGDQN
jgi:mono/diheme cytochrome c family protein